MVDAQQGLKLIDTVLDVARRQRLCAADCADQQVFGRVRGVDELDDVGAVTGLFEHSRAEGVGRHRCQPFAKDAVPGEQGQRVALHLRGQFVLTAGRGEDDVSVRAHRLRKGVVCRRVARMQGDREMCLSAGMDDYITKPIRVAQLMEALTNAPARRGT